MDIGTLIATGVTAAATVVLAIFAYVTIQAYKKQVQIGQDQVKVGQEQVRVAQEQVRIGQDQVKVSQEQAKIAQEQQFNQSRPILYPAGGLGNIIETSGGKPHVKWGNQLQEIDGLRNIGVGPALNIYGILFGLPLKSTPPVPPHERYVVWNYPALSPDKEGDKIALQLFTNLSSETTIGGYPLYVPDDADHIGIIARFTLTYHDVFNRKHASIYDYHAQYGWMCRGHFPNIEHDIRELDRQTLMTQQAEQYWIAAGKIAQP